MQTMPAAKRGRLNQKEMIMSKLIQSVLAVAVLLIGTLSSTADSAPRPNGSTRGAASQWTDLSDPYGGYGANTPEGNRAFWDYRARHGGR
jgi:hypothetical protein